MTRQTLHASCVAVEGKGLLILGRSGAGKSALALQLIAMGALLVADDRTEIAAEKDHLIARCPSALSGLIEARGVGILHAPTVAEAQVALVVDLDQTETARLPPLRSITLLGSTRDLVFASHSDHFTASVLCYLRYGRQA